MTMTSLHAMKIACPDDLSHPIVTVTLKTWEESEITLCYCRQDLESYNYQGYELTPGVSSESSTPSEVESISERWETYHCCRSVTGFWTSTVKELAGLILISPIKSCVSVVPESLAVSFAYSDSFFNIEKIGRVACLVLIIHGGSIFTRRRSLTGMS